MSYCDKLRQRAVTSCDGLLRQNTGKRWRFHEDMHAELPLKRIWAVASAEEEEN